MVSKGSDLKKIKILNSRVQELRYADSLGVDFHKTGFCPYVSSLFIVKQRKDFYKLNSKKEMTLDELYYGNYNPFEATLELTRPSSGPIMALTTLKSLGIKGFQEIIANMFVSTEKFREILVQNDNIIMLNENTEWLATLFIIKPEKYKMLSIEEILKLNKSELEEIKKYNINYAKYILEKAKNDEISFTCTSSRSYKIPKTDIKLGALKAYPMSVFFNNEEVKLIVKEVFNSIDDYKRDIEKFDYMKLFSISDDMVYRDKK